MDRLGKSRALGPGVGPHFRACWRRRKEAIGLISAAALVLVLGGCASSQRFGSTWGGASPTAGSAGSRASPRVVTSGQIPKGGGVYKLGSPYTVDGVTYVPREDPGYDRRGIASWYGEDFHGRRTANGEIYDMHALTAAHPTLPLPSYVYVTSLETNRTILVRVNDRGPFVGGRLIDLSHASARALGLAQAGTGPVRVRYAGPAPLNGNDARERRYLASQSWSGGQNRFASLEASPPSSWPPAYMAGAWSATSYRSEMRGR